MSLNNDSIYAQKGFTLSRTKFENIKNPSKLHFIAARYNLDNGIQLLKWIVESPLCDQGTAKLIFWKVGPSYYTQFNKDTVNKFDEGVYNLLRTIIRNFENGFYKKGNCAYNPSDYNDANYINPNAQWSIPAVLKLPTKRLNSPKIGNRIRYQLIN